MALCMLRKRNAFRGKLGHGKFSRYLLLGADLEKSSVNTGCSDAGRFKIHPSTTGDQSRSVSETKMMPARDTVAGEAFTKVST